MLASSTHTLVLIHKNRIDSQFLVNHDPIWVEITGTPMLHVSWQAIGKWKWNLHMTIFGWWIMKNKQSKKKCKEKIILINSYYAIIIIGDTITFLMKINKAAINFLIW